MPVDFNSNPDTDPTRVESDTPMFAPIRTSKKGEKGSFFSDREPEPRVIPADTTPATATPATATPATGQRLDKPAESAFAAPPTYAGGRTTVKRNSSLAPMAIVGGLVLLAGAGAAGWYATQPHDNGVAQLTPGAVETTVTPAADQLAQAPPPAPEPAAAPSASAKPAATARAEPAPRPARARAAASRAAGDEGVNASAIVPAPRPLTPAPVNPAPPQAAPAPAPTPVTPPPGDTPLPTQSAPPSPPQQSPTPPPTEVPPQ